VAQIGRTGQTLVVDFVTGVFATWLLEQMADAGRGRLVAFLLGDEQERALRSAAATAIQRTAADLRGPAEAGAAQLAMVIDEVFRVAVPEGPSSRHGTLLEMLRDEITSALAPAR
jgi:hypothetical protein